MISFAAALLLSVSAPSPTVQQPAPWHDWTEARPIDVPSLRAPALVRLALPSDVYGQSRTDLADLRVIDARGAQQPFAIDQALVASARSWQDASLSEQGFVPGKYSQAVADVGIGRTMHDLLTIETTADEFSTWVEVAASDDESTWRIVRARAPIFRFTSDGFAGSLDVGFAPTRARWLRVRVLDAATDFPITGCRVAEAVRIVPDWVAAAADIPPDPAAPPKQTRLTVDLGIARVPVSDVRFRVGTAAFDRAVAVVASSDGSNWADVYDGEIYRDSQGGSSLEFNFPEARGRYWRLIIYNRDDAPLQSLRATLLATPRYVTFLARPNVHYRLIFGNAHAIAPSYDFSVSTSADERAHAQLALLGRLGNAMNPIAPIIAHPWTESHAGILWAALILAVAVLGWLAFRAMR
ncbi:MAG TPA: DUF3999 family protein [Candidatus Eremiobacteraceae bacterium]|nr:DUF3999 family protein [Candidatus Eremiobacteraceae bacterium]